MSHLTQMLGLTANNFLDFQRSQPRSVIRRHQGRSRGGGSKTIGNFWVDLTRATLYLYLPVSIVVALGFVALGVPQTLHGSVEATTLEGAKQVISLGPVASQEAIKMIGTNGGGFFNANSAHPFENPSVWSNMLQAWTMLVIPVALVFAFGRLVGDPRQGRALLFTPMAVFFLLGLCHPLSRGSRRQSHPDGARRRFLARQYGGQGSALRPGAGLALCRRDDGNRHRGRQRNI